MKTTLANYFKAAFPGVAIQTSDEARACADVIAAAKQVNRSVVTWSATEGMMDVSAGNREVPDTQDLMAACAQRRQDTVFILRDPHTWPFERDPVLLRSFRDFVEKGPAEGCTVVILAPSFQPHPTMEKLVVVMDYELPNPDELTAIAKETGESAPEGCTSEVTPDLLRALGGMTSAEAANALALSIVETRSFDPKVIYREKVKAVKKTGLLELVEPDPRGLEGVGGLENLKAWIGMRRGAWSPEAEKFGIKQPKGLLLVGVPGTGKSLSAKAIGTALGVPTIKMDIGSLFNSLVGESERQVRDVLALAEAISPCVLWVDEIDKGMAGMGGSGSGDSGVGRRVFGKIITWMQEKKKPVFVVATANQVSALPPELLRKGRFDEIFSVDIPTAEERRTIFGIHLAGCGRDPSQFDMMALSAATESFTGGEIESVVNEALFEAFSAKTELTTQNLINAARATVPLAVTMKSEIEAIREWGKTRARPASRPEVVATSGRRLK